MHGVSEKWKRTRRRTGFYGVGWRNRRRALAIVLSIISLSFSLESPFSNDELISIRVSLHCFFSTLKFNFFACLFFQFRWFFVADKVIIFTQFLAWVSKGWCSRFVGWQSRALLLIHESFAVPSCPVGTCPRHSIQVPPFRQMNLIIEPAQRESEKCAVSSWFIYCCFAVALSIICNLILVY